jgi:hypothetical protein
VEDDGEEVHYIRNIKRAGVVLNDGSSLAIGDGDEKIISGGDSGVFGGRGLFSRGGGVRLDLG